MVHLRDVCNKLSSYVQFSPLSQVRSLFLPEARVERGQIFQKKKTVQKPWTKILLVVNVGSQKKNKSNQLNILEKK